VGAVEFGLDIGTLRCFLAIVNIIVRWLQDDRELAVELRIGWRRKTQAQIGREVNPRPYKGNGCGNFKFQI
jgi:hypothetical protein